MGGGGGDTYSRSCGDPASQHKATRSVAVAVLLLPDVGNLAVMLIELVLKGF